MLLRAAVRWRTVAAAGGACAARARARGEEDRDATLGVTYASLDDGTDATTDADDDARRDRFERR